MNAANYKDSLILMARYNQWMNGKVLTLTAGLPEADLWADRGAFFKSVMGTLNHICVGDLLWLNRMRGLPGVGLLTALDDMARPQALTEILYSSVAEYSIARPKLDDLFIAFIAALPVDALDAPFDYHDSRGNPHHKTLGLVLTHVFNHQTHHRGQVTTLLNQMGHDVGVTDLHVMAPEL
ncbi:MAG TPA: DinB family protein [Asticcacaulis sp.]|nr:DinB family protein [Asticcacaulis sp.]